MAQHRTDAEWPTKISAEDWIEQWGLEAGSPLKLKVTTVTQQSASCFALGAMVLPAGAVWARAGGDDELCKCGRLQFLL